MTLRLAANEATAKQKETILQTVDNKLHICNVVLLYNANMLLLLCGLGSAMRISY